LKVLVPLVIILLAPSMGAAELSVLESLGIGQNIAAGNYSIAINNISKEISIDGWYRFVEYCDKDHANDMVNGTFKTLIFGMAKDDISKDRNTTHIKIGNFKLADNSSIEIEQYSLNDNDMIKIHSPLGFPIDGTKTTLSSKIVLPFPS
jgi:hypothetical protein